MKTVYCFECQREVEEQEYLRIHVGPHSVCPSGAERSEAAQRCPNSATGSADARAADEAGADSSGRSAEANGPAQRLLATWGPLKTVAEKTTALAYCIERNYWEDALEHLHDLNKWIALNVRVPDAPQRSVERVRLPNEKAEP